MNAHQCVNDVVANTPTYMLVLIGFAWGLGFFVGEIFIDWVIQLFNKGNR